MSRLRILHVVGARPNFIKIAPVLSACSKRRAFESILVHTGQHYDDEMSRWFFEELGIPRPDLDLGVGSGSHADQTASILTRFEPVVRDKRPDLVLVVGDVNSTLACSLVGAKEGVPVAHVEAGLRSFDRSMPEEINRVVTDALSELLFVSEPSGLENLRREGIDDAKVHFVGNVMIDSLLAHQDVSRRSRILEVLDLDAGGYAVLTLHRPSNVDRPEVLGCILDPIRELARELPVVFPVHPRTRQRLAAMTNSPAGSEKLAVIQPLGYVDFLRLMSDAKLVITDSGGIQEETTILGVPCVTVRENTERPVTLSHGTNRLAGTTSAGIRESVAAALAPATRPPSRPPLWDGQAAERIAGILECWAGVVR